MKIIVDRIEGNKICVELENKETAIMDLSIIPSAKEGDVIELFVNEQETKTRKENADNLLKELFKE